MKFYSLSILMAISVNVFVASFEIYAQENDALIRNTERRIEALQNDAARFAELYDDTRSAKALTDAAERLRIAFNRNKSFRESSDEFQDVVNIVESIEAALDRCFKAQPLRSKCRYHGKTARAKANLATTVSKLKKFYKEGMKIR